jgi:hypothetical protein
VSSRAFGFDHRESLGRPFHSTRYRELREKLLGGRKPATARIRSKKEIKP